MKKLMFLSIVFFSSLGSINAQNGSVNKSKIDNAMDEYVQWYKTTKSFKVGGNDMAAVGILKNIFFDSDMKYQYGKINPDITKLEINAGHKKDIFSFKTCSYEKWINSIQVLDKNKYETTRYYYDGYLLSDGHMVGTELINIRNKETGEEREIWINYYDYSIRSIFDTNRSLFK